MVDKDKVVGGTVNGGRHVARNLDDTPQSIGALSGSQIPAQAG
jgi:hypothetical protein